MAVIGVLAEADVPNHQQLRYRPLHCANRLLDDPLVVVGFRAGGVLRRWNPEENDAAQSERRGPLCILHQLIDGQLRDAGQRRDGPPQSLAVRHKERPYALRWNYVRLGHQAPEGGRTS